MLQRWAKQVSFLGTELGERMGRGAGGAQPLTEASLHGLGTRGRDCDHRLYLTSALSDLQSALLLFLASVVSFINERGKQVPITGPRAHLLSSQTLEHKATAHQAARRGLPCTLGTLQGNSQKPLSSSSETFHR